MIAGASIERRPLTFWPRAALVAMAGATAIAAILVLAGFSSWILLLSAPIPWFVFVSGRRGVGIAGAAVVLLSFWLLLAVLMVTPLTGLGMVPVVVIVWFLAGIAGVVACWRDRSVLRRPSAMAIAVWVPAALGAVVWLAVTVAANFVPGAARLAWVMQGDSANNVLFAREVIYRNGIGIGPSENPVPLPSALMGIAMASGRDGVAAQDLLRHDLTAFATSWSLLIGLTCIVVGATIADIIRRTSGSPLFVGTAGALGSLIPLSWFVTGYPLEFGFFNTHVALPVVLAGFIAYQSSRAQPAISLGLLTVSASLLLAVWSPLVLMPAGLGLVIVLRRWRTLVATRGPALWFLCVGIVQLMAYGIGVVLPSLLNLVGFLSAPGGAFGFRKWMVVALAVGAVALAVIAARKVRDSTVLGFLAIATASALGLAALLFVSRNEPNPWSYYPLKFSWLASTVLLVFAAAAAAAVVSRYVRPMIAQLAGLSLVAAGTVGFLEWAPSSGVGYVANPPISRVLAGDFLGQGDEVVDQIIELADPDQAHFLWHSGHEFEGSINFWVMQMWSDSMSENLDLKYAAYGLYDPDSIDDLCRIVDLMGGDTVVHTSEVGLEDRLREECGSDGATVVRAAEG